MMDTDPETVVPGVDLIPVAQSLEVEGHEPPNDETRGSDNWTPHQLNVVVFYDTEGGVMLPLEDFWSRSASLRDAITFRLTISRLLGSLF